MPLPGSSFAVTVEVANSGGVPGTAVIAGQILCNGQPAGSMTRTVTLKPGEMQDVGLNSGPLQGVGTYDVQWTLQTVETGQAVTEIDQNVIVIEALVGPTPQEIAAKQAAAAAEAARQAQIKAEQEAERQRQIELARQKATEEARQAAAAAAAEAARQAQLKAEQEAERQHQLELARQKAAEDARRAAEAAAAAQAAAEAAAAEKLRQQQWDRQRRLGG